MKQVLLCIMLALASLGALADTTAQSQSGSASEAAAASQAGAAAVLNYTSTVIQTVPELQRYETNATTNATVNSTSHDTVNATTHNTNNDTINATTNALVRSASVSSNTNTNTNHDTIENKVSGGTRSEVVYSGSQTIKNVPGIAMSGPASGPCTGASGGIGLAGPGFGFGLNAAKVEPSCVVRENTRVLGMAMQSLDGATYPQQKGELMVLMMDAARGLAAMNAQIINEHKAK